VLAGRLTREKQGPRYFLVCCPVFDHVDDVEVLSRGPW
jgi:hypothetical protein